MHELTDPFTGFSRARVGMEKLFSSLATLSAGPHRAHATAAGTARRRIMEWPSTHNLLYPGAFPYYSSILVGIANDAHSAFG